MMQQRRPGALARLARGDGAQSIVEFALVLPVLMLILMGILQFGLIFNAYVTLSNAVREGAREASFYVHDSGISAAANDTARLASLKSALIAARGALNMSPTADTDNFSHTASWSPTCGFSATSPCTTTAGDISVTWTRPSGITENEPRRGYQMTVEAHYHQEVFIPLLDAFLPDDPDKGSGAWFRLPARMTVVIN